MTRQPGELLHPGRMTPEELERLKREISQHAFASQYQQRPVLGGSRMCSIDRLVRYDKPPKFELIMHSWDIGATLEAILRSAQSGVLPPILPAEIISI